MADYNVQMKQFNGTSFDNILPYASQALTLAGGGGATEIIAQARAGLSQIATGSYVGTGSGYTVNISIPFKPKAVFVYSNYYEPITGQTMYSYSTYKISDAGKEYIGKDVYKNELFPTMAFMPIQSFQSPLGGGGNNYFLLGGYIDGVKWPVDHISYNVTSRVNIIGYAVRELSYDESSGLCSLSVVEYQVGNVGSSYGDKLSFQTSYAKAYNTNGSLYHYIAFA